MHSFIRLYGPSIRGNPRPGQTGPRHVRLRGGIENAYRELVLARSGRRNALAADLSFVGHATGAHVIREHDFYTLKQVLFRTIRRNAREEYAPSSTISATICTVFPEPELLANGDLEGRVQVWSSYDCSYEFAKPYLRKVENALMLARDVCAY